MEIRPRRYGFTKEHRERIEKLKADGIPIVEVGGALFTKGPYDGSRLRPLWECDPDDPFPIPLTLPITDPELYARLIEERAKVFAEAFKIAKQWTNSIINTKGVVGKAIIISTVGDGDKDTSALYEMFMNSDSYTAAEPSETGLKRFFKPTFNNNDDEI